MTLHRLLLPGTVLVLSLSGCDKLLGDKGKDGESVGYACRVSSKLPEDCMKENPAYTPTSVLTGWKAAEADLTGKKPDAHADKPAEDGADKPEGEEGKPEEEKPDEEKPESGEGKSPDDKAKEAKH